MTPNFLTFHHASLFPRLVVDLFIWLPLNHETIFPFLLEIYLQLMLLKRLLNKILFTQHHWDSESKGDTVVKALSVHSLPTNVARLQI